MPGQISIVGFSRFIGAPYAGVIVAAIWIRRLPKRTQFVHRLDLIFLVSWVPDLFDAYDLSPATVRWQHAAMRTFTSLITILFAALIATPSFAQTSGTSPAVGSAPVGAATAPTGQPNPQEMMKQMMEMSKLNENHKLLADMNGSWNYTIKMWMNPNPNDKQQESKGTAARKSAMSGRYITMDVTGKLQITGEDNIIEDMKFKAMAVNKKYN